MPFLFTLNIVIMKKNKNFRISRSVKADELVNRSQLLQKTLQKIVGGRTQQAGTVTYGRLAGYMEPQ